MTPPPSGNPPNLPPQHILDTMLVLNKAYNQKTELWATSFSSKNGWELAVDFAGAIKELEMNHQILTISFDGKPLSDADVTLLCTHLSAHQFVRNIILTNSSLSPNSILQLCTIISQPDCILRSLDLGGNNIGPKEMADISRMMKVNTSLRILRLRNCQNIDADSIEVFVQSILSNPLSRLEELALDHSPFGDAAIPFIVQLAEQNKRLRRLYLVNVNLTDKGAKLLAKYVRNAQHPAVSLFFTENPGITADGVKSLTVATELQSGDNCLVQLGPFEFKNTCKPWCVSRERLGSDASSAFGTPHGRNH